MTPDEIRESAKRFIRCGRDPVPCSAFGDALTTLADLAESHAALRKEVDTLQEQYRETDNEVLRLGGAEGSMGDE